MGRPLYPQLSGHCNRPFPRDSRVFTRRLTPNLVCSRSHTKSRARLHKRTITAEQSRDTTVTEQLYKVIWYTWSQDNTLYRGIHSIHQLGKVYTRQTTMRYKSIHHNTRAYSSTDSLSVHHHSDRDRQLRYAPVKAYTSSSDGGTHQHTRACTNNEDVRHNYAEAKTYKRTVEMCIRGLVALNFSVGHVSNTGSS